MEHTVKVRRVGSVTFGVTLICFGILFLIHIFVPEVTYEVIFQCWPVVFVLLGIEILIENRRCKVEEYKFVYDFPAVLMLAALLCFAMVMAAVDVAIRHEWMDVW